MGAERTIDMAEDKNIFFDSYELEQSDLADLADLFKVFGDATRISIMFALLKQELSVGDIAERLEMIGYFTPAQGAEAGQIDKKQKRGQEYNIFPGR